MISPATDRRAGQATGLTLVGLGIALRVLVYLQNRPLWNDEVLIALNLRTRSLVELFAPLDFGQIMTFPDLLAFKLSAVLFGTSELALRLPALLAGCALLVVIWRRLPSLLGPGRALVLLAFAAVFEPLIYYSSELKQYGIDALLSVILVAETLAFLRDPAQPGAWRRLTAWGVIGLVCSQPVLLVLSAVGLVLLVSPRVRHTPGYTRRLATLTAVWGVTLALMYVLIMRRGMTDPYMLRFWAPSMLGPGPDFLARVQGAIWTLSGGDALPGLRVRFMVPLLLLGLAGMARDRRWAAVLLLTGTYAALLAAAALGAYPLAVRLVLFIMPLLFWMLAEGIMTVAGFLPKLHTPLAVGLTAACAVPALVRSAGRVIEPIIPEPSRHLTEQVREVDPGAPVMVPFGSYFGWAYYAEPWPESAELLASTRRFYDCIIIAPQPAGCSTLRFDDVTPAVIVALDPSLRPDDRHDAEWADRQSRRLLEAGAPYAWIVATTYPMAYSSRRLIERLVATLRQAGASVLEYPMPGTARLYRVGRP